MRHYTRRFLQIAAVGLIAFVPGALIGDVTHSTGIEFLLDDQWIDHQTGVHRVLGKPVKHAEPLLPPDLNPKLKALRINTVLFDEQEAKFKMWYRAISPKLIKNKLDAKVDPSEQDPEDHQAFLCYAESQDGIHWTLPKLGKVSFEGSIQNNIVLEFKEVGDGVYFNIVKDVADPDPKRRYKATGYQKSTESILKDKPAGNAGIVVAYSADGLDWPVGARLVMDSQDVTDSDCIFPQRDPVSGKWIGFFRPRTAPKRRFIGYSESSDFDHWTYPRMLITPDRGDPEWIEFYGITPALVDQWRIAVLWVFHNNPIFSPITNELVFSRNGTEYHRVAPGTEFLPLGPPGSADNRQIVPVSMIQTATETLIYYNGSNYEHGSDRGTPMQRELRLDKGAKPRNALGLARLPWGQFSGLRAPMDGMVETKWLTNYGPAGVHAIATLEDDGIIQAELVDHLGSVIPGWSRAESRVRTGKDGKLSFYWTSENLDGQFGQVSSAGKKVGHIVKLRFYLHKATLYGFRIGQGDSTPVYQ